MIARRWIGAFALALAMTGTGCDATETGNPDLTTGDAAEPPSRDGGNGAADGGYVPPPPFDGGSIEPPPADAGVEYDAGGWSDEDAGEEDAGSR